MKPRFLANRLGIMGVVIGRERERGVDRSGRVRQLAHMCARSSNDWLRFARVARARRQFKIIGCLVQA